MLDLFKELVNEHGSSTILKERLGLIQEKYSALERRCADLETENKALKAEIQQIQRQAKTFQCVAGKDVFCSHCGSSNLKRTGSRPDMAFGAVGVNRIVFSCLDCHKESDFLDV